MSAVTSETVAPSEAELQPQMALVETLYGLQNQCKIWRELADLAREPIVASEVNPGVINRFQREELAEFQNLPSPYKVDKGGKRPFLVITEAGRKVLAEKAAK